MKPPRRNTRALSPAGIKSSQVNTLPKAKSKTRSKQNKDMGTCSSVYSERYVRSKGAAPRSSAEEQIVRH